MGNAKEIILLHHAGKTCFHLTADRYGRAAFDVVKMLFLI